MIILDRFEEGYAVIENTDENGEITFFNVDRNFVSPDAREGDILYLRDGIYYTDIDATEQRRREMLEYLRNITTNKKC